MHCPRQWRETSKSSGAGGSEKEGGKRSAQARTGGEVQGVSLEEFRGNMET